MKPFEFYPTKNHDDPRGDSFFIPQEAIDFVGQIDEIHYVTIQSNAVRGNHYHQRKREALLVSFADKMRLAWRTLEDNTIVQRDFIGKDAIIIHIQPNVIHAVQNTGNDPIHLISFSNKRHDPQNPDIFREILLK